MSLSTRAQAERTVVEALNAAQANHRRITALYEDNAATLLGYFLRRIGDRDDAADLVADTALTLWRRASDLPGEDEAARMWLFGIARNTLSGYRRGRRRHSALADRLREEVRVAPAFPEADRRDEVLDAVRALGNSDRELIGLVHWEGFSITQAAAILGIRAGAAQMRCSRARTRLRALLT